MQHGRLVLNGVAVSTERAGDVRRTRTLGADESIPRYKESLPSGRRYFVLDSTKDSAAENTDEFVVPDGHVFVLGDNRDNSNDNRFMQSVGFVPFENLIGRAELIYGSKDQKHVLTWVN